MTDEQSTINLKILSPSTEVEGGVSFTDLPTTTTIKELRSRIRDAVASRPSPERMRLIYRGRVVANEADTLGNVFGADNMRESKDQSLHLVLRELPPSSTASSSTAPRASTGPPTSPPLQTNPFRTLPRPNSQPQAPPPHPHHHHHHPHVHRHVVQGPFHQIPLPPAIQQQMVNMSPIGQLHPAQAPNAPNQPSREGTPAPENGAPVPPTGLPPLPGFGPQQIPNGHTLRQEGMGPTGERWTVTYNSSRYPIPGQGPNLPRPFQQPPVFGMPPRPTASPPPAEVIDLLLPHLRSILQAARQEMENITTLLNPPGQQTALPPTSPPSWRLERIRQHVQNMRHNLTLVERGLAVITADASMTDSLDVISLRTEALGLRERWQEFNRRIGDLTLVERGLPIIHGDQGFWVDEGALNAYMPVTEVPTVSLRTEAHGLRERMEEFNRTIGRQQGTFQGQHQPSPANNSAAASSTPPAIPSNASAGTSASQPQTHAGPQTMPPGTPEELFILSSPQGPVGILFDQRGTYMTAPFVPTLPFQTFTTQFAQNRQLIAGLGQQIAHGSSNLHNQLANIQNTPTQQPTPTGQPQTPGQPPAQGGEQGQPQRQVQAQAQAQNANPPANPQADVPGMGNIGRHLWTFFKIACFVYFFSSGGGWYKSLMLGLVAGAVYLAQLGLFEEHFAVIREYFEGILPVGALPERLAQPQNANRPAPLPARNLTPEEAAQRILQQRRDERFGWVRDGVRTVERSVSLFVASLWPGIGERMVHAQEERERLERVAIREAEEERRRREEAEAEAAEKKDEPAAAQASNGEEAVSTSSSAKGKERADAAQQEGNPVGGSASS